MSEFREGAKPLMVEGQPVDSEEDSLGSGELLFSEVWSLGSG